MKRTLNRKELLLVASMLFGLFFGAGNLIFPVYMGQQAGRNLLPATLGFLVTGVGLPLLGVAALGISRKDGVLEMSSQVGKGWGIIFTSLLYLTIGPFFAIPRCATVSFTVGLESLLPEGSHGIWLAVFSFLFFLAVLFFSCLLYKSREIFVDARDVEDAAGLPDRGRTKLSELTPQESFEVTVTSEWYKRRWDLGDIVTVIDEDTGLTLTERITEVEEAQDASGYESVPTMGVPESNSSGTSSGSSSGGSGGGDLTYTHTQLQPAEVWTIEHNLGKHPSVTVADSAGSVVMGDVEYLDRNTVQVTFMAAFAGTAHLN